MRIVVDTSALYAVLNPRDGAHARAARILRTLRRNQDTLIIPRIVQIEIMVLITRDPGGFENRRKLCDDLHRIGCVFDEHVPGDFTAAESLWRKHAANPPTEFPDCLLVATAKRLRVDAVWTYDARTLGKCLYSEAKDIRLLGLEKELA